MTLTTSALADLADAMVTSLETGFEDGRLSIDCDVARVYEADFELDKVKDYTAGGQAMVRLSPEDEPDQESAGQNRGFLELDYRIQVCVAAKVPNTLNESVDPVMALLQELRDYFFKQESSYYPTGWPQNFTKIETGVYFDRARLIEQNLVVSVFFLTYRTVRNR